MSNEGEKAEDKKYFKRPLCLSVKFCITVWILIVSYSPCSCNIYWKFAFIISTFFHGVMKGKEEVEGL